MQSDELKLAAGSQVVSLAVLVYEQGQADDAQTGLGDQQSPGNPEEWTAVTDFENVGEDASDEAEQEGNSPETRLTLDSCGDENEKDCGDDERCGVAEVAAGAEGSVKSEGSECGDGDSCKGECAE